MTGPVPLNQAIRDMILLIELFKRILSDKIDIFKENKDVDEFHQGITGLRKDLKMFEAIFDVSYQEAETAEEFQQLEEFAKELGEARGLIWQATSLIKPLP